MEYKTYKIFDLDDFARLTKGIKVAQCMRTDTSLETRDDSELLGKLEDLCVSEKLFCSFCNASFEDSAQQRQHYKLDWHRYNLKKKLADKKAVTEDKFSQLADLDDVSSISGSESESDEETGTDASSIEPRIGGARRPHAILASRHTKVFFENEDGTILSIYRCLLHGKKDVPERDELFVPLALKTATSTKWAIIMLGGGHFAAGIFEGREVIAHKTFHCYTVRKGQGGTQSARDSRSVGSHPKSAGASLRRYNEAALLQHVQDITTAWAGDLASCHLIFHRASGHNSAVLFGGRNPPLVKTDPRLRTVPFPTRRATFSEVKRVLDVLASLEVYGPAGEFKTFPQSPRKKPMPRPADAPSDPSNPDGSFTEANATDGAESPDSQRDRGPRRVLDRAKARSSPVRPLPDIVIDLAKSSPSESGDEFDLAGEIISEDLELDFGDILREFDDCLARGLADRRRKAARRKKKKLKWKKAPVVVDKRPEMATLRGDLLSACSIGDREALERSLASVAGDEEGVPTEGDLVTCLNESVDAEGNRLLHLAARGGHLELIRLLMEAGSDPSIKNKRGQPPYVSSSDKESRNTFRRFLAEYPDKYDYDKSQIPGGLTDDILKEQAEKKRAMNKAKRDRIKQKKKEDDERKAEQSEKERFLQLTDREKRALAAERRLLSESARGGGPKVVVSRCFLCAVDISGQVPFEYNIHRFCSITCLKSHRMLNKS